jgi:tRNA pseudouridine32 synthase / 23S rRNA pseudouridine746 synthase
MPLKDVPLKDMPLKDMPVQDMPLRDVPSKGMNAESHSPKAMTPKTVTPKTMTPKTMTSEQIVSRLLYRDGLMLVIDKPAGFAVHRGPKGGESLEDYFDALRFGLPRAPALAHRLDRDTSGCLVLGRHRKALAQLGKLFKSGMIGKTYWAVVENGPEADEGQIELPLGRLDVTRGWWMKHDPSGQPALTKWKVMGRTFPQLNSITSPLEGEPAEPTGPARSGRPDDKLSEAGGGSRRDSRTSCYPPPQPSPSREEGARQVSAPAVQQLTWLALEPLTGRTHQLRVHCAAIDWPILGDAIYGTASRDDGSHLHLHAREVIVPLYKNRPPIRVVAPVPEHMRAALALCGWRAEGEQQHHRSL